MRPISITTFIAVVYCADETPPSIATVRRRCPEIPGAFRDGRRWAILNQMWEEERREFDAELMAGNLSMCDPIDDANHATGKAPLYSNSVGTSLRRSRLQR